MILIDLIIIAIMALCIFLGYKRGLIGVAFKIVSFLIAVVVTFILYIPVSNFVIKNTTIDDNIKNAIVEKFDDNVNEEKTEKDGIPDIMLDYINRYTTEVKDAGVEVAAQNISVISVKLMVAVVLFLVVRIALIFVKAIISLVEKIPVLKQFNEIGGIVYGILEGLLIIYIILTIISVMSPMISDTGILAAINDSYIGSFMYNHNILLEIIF